MLIEISVTAFNYYGKEDSMIIDTLGHVTKLNGRIIHNASSANDTFVRRVIDSNYLKKLRFKPDSIHFSGNDAYPPKWFTANDKDLFTLTVSNDSSVVVFKKSGNKIKDIKPTWGAVEDKLGDTTKLQDTINNKLLKDKSGKYSLSLFYYKVKVQQNDLNKDTGSFYIPSSTIDNISAKRYGHIAFSIGFTGTSGEDAYSFITGSFFYEFGGFVSIGSPYIYSQNESKIDNANITYYEAGGIARIIAPLYIKAGVALLSNKTNIGISSNIPFTAGVAVALKGFQVECGYDGAFSEPYIFLGFNIPVHINKNKL